MLEAVVFGLFFAFPLVGVFARRWLAVALPLVAWPIFYLGLNKDWWLYGVGDGWQYVAVLFTLLGVASTALAIEFGRSLKRPPKKAPAAFRQAFLGGFGETVYTYLA